jgi:desulfoferrodoxin
VKFSVFKEGKNMPEKIDDKKWPGDQYTCEKCKCEIRVLKAGNCELTCCGQPMKKTGELNPAGSW